MKPASRASSIGCTVLVTPTLIWLGWHPKWGKLGQSTAFNLHKRLRTYRCDVWRFMTDKDVPFTNNLAEQALRKAKVKQKISGGFRTEHGASTLFTIRSYLATMHQQQVNVLDCLARTFKGQPTQLCFAWLGDLSS